MLLARLLRPFEDVPTNPKLMSWRHSGWVAIALVAFLTACAAETNMPIEASGLLTTSTSTLDGSVNGDYLVTFSVTNGSTGASYYWTVTGLVPPGLIAVPSNNTTLANSLLLAGKPLVAGTYEITIAVHKSDHTLLVPAIPFTITITGGSGGSPLPAGSQPLNVADLAGTWSGLIVTGPEANKRLSFLIDNAGVSRQATVESTVLATSTAPVSFVATSSSYDTNIPQLSWHLVCNPANGDLDCTGHHSSGDLSKNGTVRLAKISTAIQDFQAPAVASSVPANNATVSSVPAEVRVTFNELMAAAPTSALRLTGGGLPTVSNASFGTSDDVDRRTLRIQVAGLLAGATYTLTLNPAGQAGIMDLAGNPLPTTTITFSTATSTVNQPPSAIPATYTVVQGTSQPITLAGTDPEGSSLTYQIATLPTRGTFTLSSTGPNGTYTAPATTGPDSFTFTVRDTAGNTSTPATISISVVAANQAPIAFPDSIGVLQDADSQIPLPAVDPEGGTLLYTAVTLPAHGTLTGTGGVRTYRPNPGYTGLDPFTFSATDPLGATSGIATITINVVASTNSPPVAIATPPSFTFNKRQPVTQPLSKAQHAITLSGMDPDNDPLTFRITKFPRYQDGFNNNAMGLVSGRYYQFVDPVTGGLTEARATTSSTVIGPAPTSPSVAPGTMSVSPTGSLFIVVYTPVLCHTYIGQDTLEFIAIDSNGLRSAPATITMNESTNSCNH